MKTAIIYPNAESIKDKNSIISDSIVIPIQSLMNDISNSLFSDQNFNSSRLVVDCNILDPEYLNICQFLSIKRLIIQIEPNHLIQIANFILKAINDYKDLQFIAICEDPSLWLRLHELCENNSRISCCAVLSNELNDNYFWITTYISHVILKSDQYNEIGQINPNWINFMKLLFTREITFIFMSNISRIDMFLANFSSQIAHEVFLPPIQAQIDILPSKDIVLDTFRQIAEQGQKTLKIVGIHLDEITEVAIEAGIKEISIDSSNKLICERIKRKYSSTGNISISSDSSSADYVFIDCFNAFGPFTDMFYQYDQSIVIPSKMVVECVPVTSSFFWIHCNSTYDMSCIPTVDPNYAIMISDPQVIFEISKEKNMKNFFITPQFVSKSNAILHGFMLKITFIKPDGYCLLSTFNFIPLITPVKVSVNDPIVFNLERISNNDFSYIQWNLIEPTLLPIQNPNGDNIKSPIHI